MNWLLKLLPMAKKAAPALAIIAALGTYTTFIWSMAQNAQKAEYDAKLAEAAKEYKKEVDAAVEKAMATQEADFQDRLERVRSNQETVIETKEVIKYVDRIKTVPAECAPIARDVVRVLQQSTDLIRKSGRSDADQ